jgi:hypothetical protein
VLRRISELGTLRQVPRYGLSLNSPH